MPKQKKLIMWTIFMVSMLQLVNMAIAPAVRQITLAFPQYSLSSIQTAISISGIIMPSISLISAMLIRRGLVAKKDVVVTGLFILGLNAILALFLHTRFWHLLVLNCTAGIASGCYLSTIISIMMDQFEMDERQKITGYHSIFVNAGAILCGFFGGLLASWQWYGGYLVMLAGIPIGVISLLALPKEERRKAASDGKQNTSSKFNPQIFYYAAIIILFILLYSVCSSNLAVHLGNAGIESTKIAGTLTSFQMAGGAIFGFVFGRASKAFKDYLLVLAFIVLGVGLTILNVFSTSLVCAFIGVFIVGMSMSMLGPQCVFSSSNCVDENTSAVAASLINGIAPGIGSFLSPIIITNLTTAIAGESTNFRYQFVAFVAFACAAILAALTTLRSKRHGANPVST